MHHDQAKANPVSGNHMMQNLSIELGMRSQDREMSFGFPGVGVWSSSAMNKPRLIL